MKRMIQRASIVCFSLMMCLLMLNVSGRAASKQTRLLIMPFDIHSSEDLSFLQDGITTFLAYSLSERFDVCIQSATDGAAEQSGTKAAHEDALKAASRIGADYVFNGSVTILGVRVLTAMQLRDAVSGETILAFSQKGESRSDIFEHICRFLKGVPDLARSGSPPSSGALPHRSGIAADTSAIDDRQILSPAVHLKPQAKEMAFDFWRSEPFKERFISLCAGDTNGDGSNEVVMATCDRLYVKKLNKRVLHSVATVAVPGGIKIVGVDAGDINANGNAEIFVSAIDPFFNCLASFVVEWNGKTYGTVLSKQKWFYRIPCASGTDKMLLGKTGSVEALERRGVRRLIWSQGAYRAVDSPKWMDGVTLWGTVAGGDTNKPEPVFTIGPGAKLQAMDSSCRLLAITSKTCGQGVAAIEYEKQSAASIGDVTPTALFYPHQRIALADLDRNGRREVVIVRNEGVLGSLLERYRNYKSAEIEGVCLLNSEFELQWKTRTVNGVITDFAVADADNDGRTDLALIVESGQPPGEKEYASSLYIASPGNP